ncbi:hypothetical protein [Streptomyces hawaiiensis]|uniref:hypothetical protein n=1 Tax=Streptomyces hawaiiensis TaxID=67305 RepID=UPI00364E41F3
MTKAETKAVVDIAHMVWRGAMQYDAGIWFLTRHYGMEWQRARGLMEFAMSAYMTKELEGMLEMVGEKNAD